MPNMPLKMIFLGLFISLSALSETQLPHSLESFKNTQWIGVYRYMDEVLWINSDLSWSMQISQEDCIKGDSIQLEAQSIVLYTSKKDVALRMDLDKETINGKERVVLVDDEEGLPFTHFTASEKRAGNLLSINGKVIEDNLASLLNLKAPSDCRSEF